jgi:arylsulfatase A-like enzyme
MKAIMLMFDSLRRDFLAPYGNARVHTPNFPRLAERLRMRRYAV